ncbi:transposase [Methyloprofundus sp.]|uniref:transposase n=1 Tax=Methyloprofundus sp. TaxID=2020875 RepID=UPI003D13E6CE
MSAYALNAFFRAKGTLWYDLVAFAIMPNHVHLLLKPYDSLPVLMQKMKGGSAKMINEMMGRSGVFWAKDYYDKAIRDERHFTVVYRYIKHNPVKLGDKEDLALRFYGVYEGGLE